MENILIRKLRKEDADDICRIHTAITQKPVKADFKHAIKEQVQEEGDASFAAEFDGRIVGYMISYTLSGGFGISKSAWIAMMGVDPKFMGRSIGEKLAKEIFKFHKKRGIHHIYTSVSWDSADLLSFFKTLGFDRSSFINLHKELK